MMFLNCRMARTKVRRTNRGSKDITIYEEAYAEVKNGTLFVQLQRNMTCVMFL